MWVWSLVQEDPLEEGMATHSSILAWRLPWMENPGELQSIGSQRAGYDWSDLAPAVYGLRHHEFAGCLVWLFRAFWDSYPPPALAGAYSSLGGGRGLREGTLDHSNIFQIFLVSELLIYHSVQFSSFAQLCPTLCDPMNHSMPSLPVDHQLPEFTQTHVHRVSDVIQPSHPLSSPSSPSPNPSHNQSLFQWVNTSHEVAKVLEFQLQHQSFQWTPRTDLLQDGLVGSPCSPRGSQESSPTPQFKSINSSALSFLHSPTLTAIHDHWKNHSLD